MNAIGYNEDLYPPNGFTMWLYIQFAFIANCIIGSSWPSCLLYWVSRVINTRLLYGCRLAADWAGEFAVQDVHPTGVAHHPDRV